MNISVQIDMSGFNRGFALAQQFTRKTPSEACNYSAKEVAFAAYENTPVTTPQVVDAELAVLRVPIIGKRGKPIKKVKFVSTPGTADNKEVALAVLIIQARGRYGSNYNKLTNYRYALFGSPFKGVSREQGRMAMAELAHEMIAGRRRSANGFIRGGWIDSMQTLKALVPSRYGGKASVPPGQNENLGTCTPAVAGQSNTFCLIENDVGLEGQNAESHNRALMQTAPALQYALDVVGTKEMNYFLRKTGQEELEIPVNKAWA